MAATIEIIGSTFRMRLACADPVCFAPVNKNTCPIVNSKHTAPIPVHPKIIWLMEKVSEKNITPPTRKTAIVLEKKACHEWQLYEQLLNL